MNVQEFELYLDRKRKRHEDFYLEDDGNGHLTGILFWSPSRHDWFGVELDEFLTILQGAQKRDELIKELDKASSP